MSNLRLGMVGLDTSHVAAFTKIFHDSSDLYHIPGVRVAAAFSGGSPDFDVSINRVEQFTAELRDNYNVKIVSRIQDLKTECDAVLLESVDGRVHLAQFMEIADWGKPVFIDKPLTVSLKEAKQIMEVSQKKNIRVMSSSALRFSEALQQALVQSDGGVIKGADVYGPMFLQEKSPGFFWYGIHTVEMLYTILGKGCKSVNVTRNGDHDLIIGMWSDGRIGVIRGQRTENHAFGGTIHRHKKSQHFDVSASKKPFYASLLGEITMFFQGKYEPVSFDETIEVISFIEAANKSLSEGKAICLE